MFRPLAATLAMVLLVPAANAQDTRTIPLSELEDQTEPNAPPQRIRQINLAAGEECPKAAADEIVVCSSVDPNEQYRVPKALRRPVEIPAQNQSWVNRAATVDQVGRVAGGLPNTCSPIGAGGQTGCAVGAAQAWAADRRQKRREAEQMAPGTSERIDIEDDEDPRSR